MTVSEAVPKAHDIEKRTTCTCSRDDILGTLTTTDAVPKNQDGTLNIINNIKIVVCNSTLIRMQFS